MITLLLLIYVIASAFIAYDVYACDTYSNPAPRSCYRNGKRALLFGFMIIPLMLLMAVFMLVLLYVGIEVVLIVAEWMIVNLP